jgi:hypothetical protein
MDHHCKHLMFLLSFHFVLITKYIINNT